MATIMPEARPRPANPARRRSPGLISLGLLFAVALGRDGLAFDRAAFEEKLASESLIYEQYVSEDATKQLFIEGRVSEANERLENLVADVHKTVVDHFVLGNMLYVHDPAASDRHMKRAESLAPDNPLVLFERGMHEHRKGNHAGARDYYRRFHAGEPGARHPVSWAYLTHAYLMTDQIEDAFDAWQRARFGSNHTAIEKGMYAIFSRSNPERDREQLVIDINAGDAGKLCDLWTLDSNWEFDWWNYGERKKYLAFDRALAGKRVEAGSREADYFDLCTSGKTLDGEAYVARLERLGILAGDNRLPRSAALIYTILRRLTADKLMTAAQFLERFELQITTYAEANPLERKYYEILAYLYSSTGNRDGLKAVDAHGWHELKLEKFAASFIVGLDPGSGAYDAQLEAALSEFPDSVTLNRLRLVRAGSSKERALATFVASQFSDVKNNWKGPYRLNDYMEGLRHEIAKLKH